MPATLTATKMGTNSSAVRGTVACTAGLTSIDVLTVNHGLGQTPQLIQTSLRSIIAVPSAGGAGLTLTSYDATRAIFTLPAGTGVGATSAIFDIFFARQHSLVR